MMLKPFAGATLIAIGLCGAFPAQGQTLPDFSSIPELKFCIVAVQDQSEDAFASLGRTNPANASVTEVLEREENTVAHASTFYAIDDGQLIFSVDRISATRLSFSCEIQKYATNDQAAKAAVRAFGQWADAVALESDMFMAKDTPQGGVLSGCLEDERALYVAAHDLSDVDRDSADFLLRLSVADTLTDEVCS